MSNNGGSSSIEFRNNTTASFLSLRLDGITSEGYVTYVSSEVAQAFVTVNFAFVCTGLCIFGIVANIINIVVFVKQGLNDTVAITLFALAISDLVSLIALLWMAVCMNPLFQYADTPLLTLEVQNLTGGWPHVLCVKISGWLTAFVTVERCFCVVFPLKVKTMLTPTRVKVIVIAIFLLVTGSVVPTFYTTRLGWKFVPERNRTLLGLVFAENSIQIDSAAYAINGIASTFAIFVITLTSTIMLVVNLKRKRQWRQSASTDVCKDDSTSKDQRAIKMLIAIATIFIICLLPFAIVSVPMTLDPEFNKLGKRQNLFKVVCSFGVLFEAVNSSANIIVYYKMSSNYRFMFRRVILKKDENEAKM